MRSIALILIGLIAVSSSSVSCTSHGIIAPFPSLITVDGFEVRLTRGATDIESNFPDSIHAASTLVASSASGYPSRALHPLKGAVVTVGSELLIRAGIAFQASEPNFDMRYNVRPTNGEIKQLYFSDGQQAAAAAAAACRIAHASASKRCAVR